MSRGGNTDNGTQCGDMKDNKKIEGDRETTRKEPDHLLGDMREV